MLYEVVLTKLLESDSKEHASEVMSYELKQTGLSYYDVEAYVSAGAENTFGVFAKTKVDGDTEQDAVDYVRVKLNHTDIMVSVVAIAV